MILDFLPKAMEIPFDALPFLQAPQSSDHVWTSLKAGESVYGTIWEYLRQGNTLYTVHCSQPSA